MWSYLMEDRILYADDVGQQEVQDNFGNRE